MAQSKAVLAVLATAVALASTIDNAELNAGIEALQAETDANGSTQEYKDLKDVLEAIEAQEDAVEPKKYDYAGVRMIGSKWYCAKDKYKKGFSTANECAEHFNG